MTESQAILETIGTEAMQKLCDEFGGQTIYIPKRVPDPHRNEHIARLFDEELSNHGATCMSSYRKCADEFGLSVRHVKRLVTS